MNPKDMGQVSVPIKARQTGMQLRKYQNEALAKIKHLYLRGVEEDRPAVISVNMFFASMMVNEFLARLHPHRNQANAGYAYVGANLSEMQFYPEQEGTPCPLLQRHVGRGDVEPLLERTVLS